MQLQSEKIPYSLGQGSVDLFYTQKISSLNPRELITCPAAMPIYQVAGKMGLEKTSCIFIEGKNGGLMGYVTDITIRDSVVARRLSAELPVSEIVETNLVSIGIGAYVYEALLLMFQ